MQVKQPKTFDIDPCSSCAPSKTGLSHRCVEAGACHSLGRLLALRVHPECDPLPSAKYVQFLSYYDKKVESEFGSSIFCHTPRFAHGRSHAPTDVITFGLYGEVLPNQNGAPVRVVVP